jgi:methyl-accepting chemotaxis protein
MLKHYLQWRWFIVAAVVGSALNIINQYDALFGTAEIHYPKLLLTFAVPYLVASVSAWYSVKQ